MFTDKFIKLPIVLVDEDREQLTGAKDESKVTMRLDPQQIELYHSGLVEDEVITTVKTKSGCTFAVYMNIREFERKLNEFERGAGDTWGSDVLDTSKNSRQ